MDREEYSPPLCSFYVLPLCKICSEQHQSHSPVLQKEEVVAHHALVALVLHQMPVIEWWIAPKLKQTINCLNLYVYIKNLHVYELEITLQI